MTDFPKDLVLAKQRLIHTYPADFELNLRFESWTVRLRTNCRDLIADLIDYYGPFVCKPRKPQATIHAFQTAPLDLNWDWTPKTPDPGKTKVKEAWVDFQGGRAVKKIITGMTFLFGEDIHMAVGPCLENSNQIINFINNRHIQWRLERGCLLGHAAGVAGNGRGLALAGFSGAGKSTLALHIMSRGGHFVSNDRLMVENSSDGPNMFGVAKLPRINPGTALNNPDLALVIPQKDRQRFSRLSTQELWDVEHKYDAHIDQCFGPDKFHLSAPMNGLFILHWSRSDTPMEACKVNLADRPDLLEAFMKSTGLFYLPIEGTEKNDPPPKEYIRVLENTSVFELSGGVDFDAASSLGMRFLETGDIQ